MKRQPAKPQPSDDVLTFFDSVLPSPSWWPWRVFTKALYGLPMDDKEADLYRRCASRSSLPTKPFTRALVLSGRQSGKTRYEGFNIAYLASCVRYESSPGARSTGRGAGRRAIESASPEPQELCRELPQ